MEFLYAYNPFVSRYFIAFERFRSSTDAMRITLNPQMQLVVQEGADRRRENLPIADEVAVFIPEEYSESGFRDVVLAERGADGTVRGWYIIYPHSAAYFPLAYLLMFPCGDLGYRWGLPLWDLRRRGRAKRTFDWGAWCRYILHTRQGQSQVPFLFKRLFQQFLVDLWAASDQLKLQWVRHH